MSYFLLIFALAAVLFHAWFAKQDRGTLVGLALHPFNVVGLLAAVLAIDFYTLLGDTYDGRISELLGYMIVTPDQVLEGAMFFLICAVAMGTAVLIATAPNRGHPQPLRPDTVGAADLSAASIVMALAAAAMVVLASVVILESLAEGSILYVAGVRQAFFRDNQALSLLGGVGIPAFYLYGSRFGIRKSTVLYAFLLVVLFIPIGSRSSIVFLVIGLAFWWSQSHKLSLPHVYMAIPPLAVLSSFYRYVTRDAYLFPTYGDFIGYHGGYFGLLFRSPDVSLAEGITAAVTQSTIVRGPFDTLIAAATAPIPRSWITWKPFSASAEFTRNATPEHFELFGSSWTITGFVNLYLEYGYWFTVPVLFFLTWVWTRVWVVNSVQRSSAALTGPVLILTAYTFYRADLYDVALFLWPLAAVLVLHAVVRGMIGGGRRAYPPQPAS